MNIDAVTSVFGDSIVTSCPEDQPFLSDQSPQDKPWDSHKSKSVKVSDALSLGYETHQRQAARMCECANRLEFGWRNNVETGETALKLKTAHFCRVRHCPICQWRRSLMWISRFYQAFPKIYADHPEWKYIMVSFTVRNCPVSDLKKTIKEMNSAWQRLIQRKSWPGLGFVRSLEITRGSWVLKGSDAIIRPRDVKNIPIELRELKDKKTAHPHYHCLIAVPPGYFAGKNYLSTEKWAQLWQEALKIDYTPICDARLVKPKDLSKLRGKTRWETPERENYELTLDETRLGVFYESIDAQITPDGEGALQPTQFEYIFSAIKEVIKYAVKPEDMLLDPDWLIELSTQLRNSRSISLGGEFKKYLSEDEPTQQELIGESESLKENDGGIIFGWRERLERYQRNSKKSV
jgi:plasmid rolling circle replication initiator protein Rep